MSDVEADNVAGLARARFNDFSFAEAEALGLLQFRFQYVTGALSSALTYSGVRPMAWMISSFAWV